MNRLVKIALTVVVISFIYWVTNSDLEVGKYDSFKEAFEKAIPYEVKGIVHREQYDDVTIVMCKAEPSDLPHADFDVLTVAFFKGNDDEGWESIGGHSWEYYENSNMTVYDKHLHDADRKGNVLHEFHVMFGEVNNPEIVKVETTDMARANFKEARMIGYEGKWYYFQIGERTIVRGLSEDGEVVDQQGG
jgi:hypothetical protein